MQVSLDTHAIMISKISMIHPPRAVEEVIRALREYRSFEMYYAPGSNPIKATLHLKFKRPLTEDEMGRLRRDLKPWI